MMKAVWSGVAATAAVLCFTTSVFAQNTASVNVTANVAAKAKLTLGATDIAFPDSDPDTVFVIPADTAVSVSVKARTSTTGSVTLTVVATGDLASGLDVIAINNLTWTATGTGFQPTGISNKTTAQAVGGWTGSGNQSGSQSYNLVNNWAYVTGTYAVTLNYTLTAP